MAVKSFIVQLQAPSVTYGNIVLTIQSIGETVGIVRQTEVRTDMLKATTISYFV
jgi:hypothetical protein